MCQDLEFLIEAARRYEMSAEEREAQVRSFTYGNTRLENDDITYEDVERAANVQSYAAELACAK